MAALGIGGILVWVFLIFGSVLQAFLAQIPILSDVLGFFYQESTTYTVVGLFIVIYLDTLFFVIFPGELYFFLALYKGMNPVLAIAAAAFGGILGQIANYWMGRYARKKGKDRPRAGRLLRFAEKANGRGGTPFLALALSTPSPEVIGFGYGLGQFPAGKFAVMAAIFRTVKWISLYIAFVYLHQYLGVFGIH